MGSSKPFSTKVSTKKAGGAKRKAVEQDVTSKNSGTPSFMEELRGTEGGVVTIYEGALWWSYHDLYNEYCTMRAGSGFHLDMAKAMVGLHAAPEVSHKRKRLKSIVNLGDDVTGAAKVVSPIKEVKEGEISVGSGRH